MTIKAKIQFDNPIPSRLEQRLILERGFHVAYRMGHRTVFQKGYLDREPYGTVTDAPWDDAAEVFEPTCVDDIPGHRQNELGRKCTRVYDAFINPFDPEQIDSIRAQIRLMCKRERLTDIEIEWTENWVYNYVL